MYLLYFLKLFDSSQKLCFHLLMLYYLFYTFVRCMLCRNSNCWPKCNPFRIPNICCQSCIFYNPICPHSIDPQINGSYQCIFSIDCHQVKKLYNFPLNYNLLSQWYSSLLQCIQQSIWHFLSFFWKYLYPFLNHAHLNLTLTDNPLNTLAH